MEIPCVVFPGNRMSDRIRHERYTGGLAPDQGIMAIGQRHQRRVSTDQQVVRKMISVVINVTEEFGHFDHDWSFGIFGTELPVTPHRVEALDELGGEMCRVNEATWRFLAGCRFREGVEVGKLLGIEKVLDDVNAFFEISLLSIQLVVDQGWRIVPICQGAPSKGGEFFRFESRSTATETETRRYDGKLHGGFLAGSLA
jgi:hypothetical protein